MDKAIADNIIIFFCSGLDCKKKYRPPTKSGTKKRYSADMIARKSNI